ncbi:MAG: Abi family protein [Ekhidna sp.]|nr:Abi family protein [Ekhidna sp.]
MEYNKLEYFLSQQHLQRFLIAAGNSKTKAQRLYRINLRVSQAFYPILNLLEVFLRNSFNYRITSFFTNSKWIITEKDGFMSDNSLRPSGFFLKASVDKTEKAIKRKKGVVSPGKVIAEQSFGFWTSLFETHHYKLIGGVVMQCFPNKPNNVNRSVIAQKLNRIRKFRNRVYHNEPICFDGQSANFSGAGNIRDEVFEILSWIDSDLLTYAEYFNGIKSKISQANNI